MKVGLFLLGQSLLVLALTIRSFRIRRYFFPPIALISLYLVFSPVRTRLPFLANYLFACGHLSNLVIASDYLLLTDVQTQFRLKNQTIPASALSFYSRLQWANGLLCSPRGIGWTHESSKVLPRRPYEQNNDIRNFTADQVAYLALYVIVSLLVGGHHQWDPSRRLYGLLLQPIRTLIRAIPIIAFLDGIHRVLSLILVHTRYLEPKDWVPLFGSWREATSVGRFWGRVWHQMLRRFTSSHGAFVAQRLLFLGKGTRAFFYVQVLIAFFTSAVIHATTDWVFINEWRGAFCFFLLQAIAVLIEDVASSMIDDTLWVDKTSPTSRQLLGHFWVLGWFTLSFPLWRM